jgi:Tol biopolymer transport system component
MALAVGSRLGPYEILAPLGAGGMGEVYRARDGRLGREVAIKVLPESVASDPERLNRFEREARLASGLNHPNIVTVHDIGSQGSVTYIAMELVPGETLREVLFTGALPLKKLLQIAAQIADGLARAHSAGIVHRDLKPENVMVTKEGLVKILDLGLAKLTQPKSDGGTQAPTQSAGTEPGVVMGTVDYMSPEQATGLSLDFRSDQFSFGSVLYEMVTGKPAFRGKTRPETLASIIREEPEPIETLVPKTPAPLRWIVERCLAKEPRERYASTEDLARDLEGLRGRVSEVSGSGAALGMPVRRRGPRATPAILAAAVLAALVFGLLLGLYRVRLSSIPPRRLEASLNPPQGTGFDINSGLAVSPDGRNLAFATDDGRLWVRDLSQSTARELPGASDATGPFWSPDSRSVAFFAHGKLMVAELSGGSARVVCDAASPRGGAWSPEGVILFAPENKGPLFRVAAAGGEPVRATVLDASRREESHRFPLFLPDGRHFLYIAWHLGVGEENLPWILAGSLDSSVPKALLRALASPVYSSSGHLLYVSKVGRVVAQRFDARGIATLGPTVPVVDQVEVPFWRSSPVTVSRSGLLVYRSGEVAPSRLVLLDRIGRGIATVGSPAGFESFRFSPDGTKGAVAVTGPLAGVARVWIYDVSRGTGVPGITESPDGVAPVWSPDGRQICFASFRDGDANLYIAPADGTVPAQPLLKSLDNKLPEDWSPDGQWIVYRDFDQKTKADLWLLPLFGDRRPRPFLKTDASEMAARFSPDGRWLAYQSDQSGRYETYVTPFPGPGERTQVSTGGGRFPRWSRNGTEILYAAGDQVMSAEITGGSPLKVSAPKALFEMPAGTFNFEISPDSQRLLFIVADKDFKPPPLTVVVNWSAGLEK